MKSWKARILLLALSACACGSGEPVQEAEAPPRTVPYSVLDRWSIPNGGFGQVIVISRAQTTAEGLRALGEELKYDTRGDRNAFVFVYNDSAAAALRPQALRDQLSRRRMRFHDAHAVAIYNRNGSTGIHHLTAMLHGLSGEAVELNY